MKKAGMILPAFFMLLINMVNGQVYFDNLYGDIPSADGVPSGGTVKTDEGYLILSSRYIGQQNHYGFQVDLNGEFINGFYLENSDSISELGGYVLQETDSSFLVMSQWRDLSQSSSVAGDIMLSRINKHGTIYWRRKYGEEQRGEAGMSFILSDDGGVAFVGQVANTEGSNIDGQVYLLKLDSGGNMMWENDYGGSNIETGEDLLQTPDSGFLLLGWTRSYGAGQRDFYLVKTDSLGNQQWQRTYGTAGEELGSSIIQLSDGNYLLTGSGSQGTQQGSGSLGRVYKIRPDGTQIWAKTYIYNTNSGNNLHKTVEMWNGDLVSVGMTNNSSNAGYLVRTDSLGEVVWQREYDKNEYTDLFYSVLLANDGGFLLSGQARNAETNSQDAWLLKVDSVGCPYPNCTVGIDENERTKVVVDVWPNPASESLRFQVQSSRLENLTITATDMQGRTVLNYEPQTLNIELPISDWPNGLYIFTITNGQERARVRVVVQH